MKFEFFLFNYLLPYIVIYIVFGIAMASYKAKYESENSSYLYTKLIFGRYYFQRIVMNLIIIILSINNYLTYNNSNKPELTELAIFCFAILIFIEIIVFIIRDDAGESDLSDYMATKLNTFFTITNKFKVKKKVNNNFINNKEN